MKALRYLLLLSVFAAISCSDQGSPLPIGQTVDMRRFQLSTRVKSMKVRAKGKQINDINSYFRASFDSAGRISCVDYFSPDGSKGTSEKYFYDSSSGLLNELREYDSDGTQSGIYFYSYDSDGNLTRCWLMGMNSQEQMKWEHTWKCGKCTHTDFFIEGELANRVDIHWEGDNKIQNVYDATGNLVSQDTSRYLCDNVPLSIDRSDLHLRISYEDSGLPSESISVQLSPKSDFYWDDQTSETAVHKYSYRYDKHGNWTTRIETKSETGEILSKVTRKLKY